MRIIKGFTEGKKALERHWVLGQDNVPSHVLDMIELAFGERLSPKQAVEQIVGQIRENGDDSVKKFSRLFDGFQRETFEVSHSEIQSAYNQVDPELIGALRACSQRVTEFHQASKRESWVDFKTGLGEMITPIERVGIYIPGGVGGSVPYPSTVIMSVVPAKVAGVSEIVITSPPLEGGSPHPAILVAADIAGADTVFAIGGAQAIGAMAFGTDSVPRVDKICGPGNIFVALAKLTVFGNVGIDGIYGPTETLLVADDSADPELCASDLLGQAEHDYLAAPILITTSDNLAAQVEAELEIQMEQLPRGEIAKASTDQLGCIIVVSNIQEAIELANFFAPEHLCLMIKDPWQWLGKVRNAGGIFLGEYSPEAMGDYIAGPSHVMPTGGTARFNSPLGVSHFQKVSAVIALDKESFGNLWKPAVQVATTEGFYGHARAIELRTARLE